MSTAIQRRDVDALGPHPKNDELYGDDDVPPDFVESVAEHGVREPIVATPDGTIVSGHRRWRAAKAAGLEDVPVRTESYESDLAEWEALVDYNRQRDKTPAQVINEAELLMKIHERREAKERQGMRTDTSSSDELDVDFGQARDKAAEKLNVGGSTIEKGRRVKKLKEKGDEAAAEEWERMERDEQSIHGAYESVREAADDDADDADAPADLGPAEHDCVVCGESWSEWDLSDREGESVAVERVCVVSYPDDYVFHFAEGEP